MHSYFNRAKKDTGQSNIVAQNRMAGGSAFQFVDSRPEAVAQCKLQEIANNNSAQQVMQMKWTEENEAEAQEKLAPMDGEKFDVPTWNVLDQQAWAGLGNKGQMVQWGKNKFRDVLQPIDADKVVKRAGEILEGKVTMEPPPVAFSTETAVAANSGTGELILLDSHHTVNASRILRGDKTISVLHKAKPDLKGNETNAQIAASREVITRNKNTAKNYNQGELGWSAYEQAYREILKINKEGNAPMKHRREKGG